MPGIKVEIEVEGADEAATQLGEIADRLEQGIADALREAADIIVQNAQANAPVDTGFLRDNIHVEDESDTEISVVSGAEYSSFVENGTRYMDAQPFMEPALEDSRSQIEQLIRDAIAGSLG